MLNTSWVVRDSLKTWALAKKKMEVADNKRGSGILI
jgi:hypothetical protein